MNNANLYLAPACLGPMVLISVVPDYYGTDKEKHSDPQGHKYEEMLPAHRYDKLMVKIPGAPLLQAPISGSEPQVEFNDLQVRPYVDRTGRIAYTASATGVRVVGNDDKSRPVKA